MTCDQCGRLYTTKSPCEHPPRDVAAIFEKMKNLAEGGEYISPGLVTERVVLDGDFSLLQIIRLGELAREARAAIYANTH